MPQELPVDSAWEDIYEPLLPPSSGSRDEESTDFDSQRSAAQTLVDHLVWQLNLTRFSDTDRAIADGHHRRHQRRRLSDGPAWRTSGRHSMTPEIGVDEVEAVLHRIQYFDPPGRRRPRPRECLLIQLRQLPEDVPHRARRSQLVGDHFDLLGEPD